MIQKHDSLIVQKMGRLLIPFIQFFGVYVLMHGHYSPGGGFQAGVLIGASIILTALVGKEPVQFSVGLEFILAASGLLIFAGIGSLSLFYGAPFFDYGAIAFLHPEPEMRRYFAILIAEIGVTITVSMVLVLIFQTLAFLPFTEEKK